MRRTGSPRAACRQMCEDRPSASGWFNHSGLLVPWAPAVTQMRLHGLCCRKYLSPRYQADNDLRAGQRCLLTALLPPNESKKEGRDVISAVFVFVSNVLGFAILPPSVSRCVPSVRSCPRWEIPLLGRSERWCTQTLLRGGHKKGKKQQGKSFPLSSPRTL